jgi:uncharacterized protein YjiS (DUF1127 family)
MGQARGPSVTHTAGGSIGRKVADLTRRAWRSYWTQRAARATVGILHALDDRALKDIGLDRSEIESVVYGDRTGRRGGCRGSATAAAAPTCERRVCMC